MPLFKCEKCGCIENTALCDYWWNHARNGDPAKCSECETGKWHGEFPKRPATGMLIGADGFLYSEKPSHTEIVGVVE